MRFTDVDFLQKSEKMCKSDIFVNFGTINKEGNLKTKQVTQFFHQLVESDILPSFRKKLKLIFTSFYLVCSSLQNT